MLSHSGSHIPRPTLKPNITALAPRSRYQLLVRLYWIGIPPTLYQASIGTHCVCVYSAKAFSVFLFHIFSLSPLFLLLYYILFLFSSTFLFFPHRKFNHFNQKLIKSYKPAQIRQYIFI